jgi:hypothetical protein
MSILEDFGHHLGDLSGHHSDGGVPHDPVINLHPHHDIHHPHHDIHPLDGHTTHSHSEVHFHTASLSPTERYAVERIENVIHGVDKIEHRIEHAIEHGGPAEKIADAAPGLAKKFGKLHWTGKAAIIGGAATAAGAVGYWTYKHLSKGSSKNEETSFVKNIEHERLQTNHQREL